MIVGPGGGDLLICYKDDGLYGEKEEETTEEKKDYSVSLVIWWSTQQYTRKREQLKKITIPRLFSLHIEPVRSARIAKKVKRCQHTQAVLLMLHHHQRRINTLVPGHGAIIKSHRLNITSQND